MSLRTKASTVFISFFVLIAGPVLAQPSPILSAIQERGDINVCIWPDYFSITYMSPRTQHLEGIDIDLSHELANDLGVRVNYIKTHFGRFMDDLESKACDVAMFGVGNTEARRQHVNFTQSYLASNMYAVTTKQHPLISSWSDMDQAGVIVCVQKGTYMENAMRKSLKHATITTVQRPNEREGEVLSGRADVFITDYPYGQKMVNLYDWAKLIAPPGKTEQFEYAYAVAKGDNAWLKRVDQFVSDIKQDGRLAQAAAHYNLTPIMISE
ncbi:Cyclohexadienyl dehydratase precursor [Marinomonas aquimarina]|uniref:Cyclohexadienyl dehydratase n=1 Tax=Marinomonas aquimarina TaxID=295068 RepID=A0A1A8TGW2_9GAMM|nr:ABC transporter substrate-binding protein [Marinomonas aquimarina]SBS32739.1 Cyclohexadienyl dehydratase precursor [Marinomonas aquimarina]